MGLGQQYGLSTHDIRGKSFSNVSKLAVDKKNLADAHLVKDLNIFEFAGNAAKLQSLTRVREASWEQGKIKFLGEAQKTEWIDGIPHNSIINSVESGVIENYNPFKQTFTKSNHLTTNELKEYIQTTESESEKRVYMIALNKRYATAFLPLIITLFTAPFALSLSRKGKSMTVSYAVGIWLLFMGITSLFDQFGTNGMIIPSLAVWTPLVLFTGLGFYLLSKVRT